LYKKFSIYSFAGGETRRRIFFHFKDAMNFGKNKRERGASLVEYALLVALIAVIAIVAVRAVGSKVSTRFSTINSNL
jgi:Flp pilus assembly pilin Flp